MKSARPLLLSAALFALAALPAHAFDHAITGTAKVKLSGPITQEQMDQCKLDAKGRVKPPILRWLEEQKNARVDTTDLLTNLVLQSFFDSCVMRANETSAFKEKFWTFSYTVPPEAIDAALSTYNDRIELLAIHSWKRLENAIEQKNNEEIYYQSVSVIAYASGFVGPLLTDPSDSNKILIEEARGILNGFLGRLYLTSSGQIIQGKPGYPPVMPPTMAVTIDGRPFAGLGLTGYIPGGADVFNGVTDNNGVISFENLIIPFVKNGSMMYITPNLGSVINNKWRIGMKDFGIKIGNDLNQTFFFKIDRPTYTLTFEATSADPTDTLPKEFATGASMKKYLADSCWLQAASGTTPADLNIVIKCQIASALAGEFEASQARFDGSVMVQAPLLSPPRTESEIIDLEKKYDKMPFDLDTKKNYDKEPKVPLGSFVWECNKKLRMIVRTILNRL